MSPALLTASVADEATAQQLDQETKDCLLRLARAGILARTLGAEPRSEEQFDDNMVRASRCGWEDCADECERPMVPSAQRIARRLESIR